ncbi:TPA: hypothetical protein ACHYJM_005598, partial [Escherichia coli]
YVLWCKPLNDNCGLALIVTVGSGGHFSDTAHFYDVAIPYEPYGDLTMAHSLPFLPATDTAHPPMSIPAC